MDATASEGVRPWPDLRAAAPAADPGKKVAIRPRSHSLSLQLDAGNVGKNLVFQGVPLISLLHVCQNAFRHS